jgi:uncharacterized membrane protein
MSLVEKSISINAPVSTVYNQWTQFEEFPKFMEGVVSVTQLDDKHLRWHTQVGGNDHRFDTEISEQIPDTRIAWRTISGDKHAGVVTFHRLSDHETKVMVQMEYEPQGAIEKIGDMLGVFSRRLERDLEHFKEFIERRGMETGAWRGEIHRSA